MSAVSKINAAIMALDGWPGTSMANSRDELRKALRDVIELAEAAGRLSRVKIVTGNDSAKRKQADVRRVLRRVINTGDAP